MGMEEKKISSKTIADFPCPACGFLVFSSELGSYDLCPVCDWEDDFVQYKFPTMGGGANTLSLQNYQQKWLQILPVNITEHKGYSRDSKWRPLEENDLLLPDQTPKTGRGYFDALTDEQLKYYWEHEE